MTDSNKPLKDVAEEIRRGKSNKQPISANNYVISDYLEPPRLKSDNQRELEKLDEGLFDHGRRAYIRKAIKYAFPAVIGFVGGVATVGLTNYFGRREDETKTLTEIITELLTQTTTQNRTTTETLTETKTVTDKQTIATTYTKTVTETPTIITTQTTKQISDKLLDYIPKIKGYPLAIDPSIKAVENVVYKNRFDAYKGDEFIWSNGVSPAIEHVLSLEDNGEIDILKTGPQTGDATLDMLLLEKQILPHELTSMNMETGYQPTAPGIPDVNVFLSNVTPNEDLNGLSPQEFRGEQIRDDYKSKGEAYDWSLINAGVNAYGSLPGDNWPNSYTAYKSLLNRLISGGEDKPAFIKGWPPYARDPKKNIIPKCQGADAPYYSVLVGRELGYPVIVYTANYPQGKMLHDEPGVWVPKYQLFFVLWNDMDEFIKDYQNKPNEPNLKRIWDLKRIETLIG